MARFSNNYKKSNAASGKKFGIDYSETYDLIKRLEQLEGNVKATTEKALKEPQKNITKNLHNEMKKHKRTGVTEKSLVENPDVEWHGTTAEIDVGFDIDNGGLPSIFLMYGTPRMEKDKKLFNAIYGSKTRKEITEMQKDIFYDEIRRLNG